MSEQQPEQIMLPRLGAHISAWGSGHTCDKPGQPHDGPCVCACGIVQPYDQLLPEDDDDDTDA